MFDLPMSSFQNAEMIWEKKYQHHAGVKSTTDFWSIWWTELIQKDTSPFTNIEIVDEIKQCLNT